MFNHILQTFSFADSPIRVDEKTGEVTSLDMLREPTYTFTMSVIDGAGHEDTTTVVVCSTTVYIYIFIYTFIYPPRFPLLGTISKQSWFLMLLSTT